MSNRDWALRLAEVGISVFPCGDDKKPLIRWREFSSSDTEAIAQWWHQFPNALPAIDLEKSELFVLDGDRHGGPDGRTALRELLQQQSDFRWQDAPSALTPGDGAHVYFAQNGHELGNARGGLPDGVDARGCGGYVICPYATLADGRSYKAAPGTADLISSFKAGKIPQVPQGIVDLIKIKDQAGDQNHTFNAAAGVRERAHARATLQSCVIDLIGTNSGVRNIKLNAIAFRLGRMIARGWIERAAIEGALLGAMFANKAVADDGVEAAKATIKSGVEAGMGDPHPDLPEDKQPASAQTSGDQDLDEMNAAYAVVKVGGKTRVVEFEESPSYPGSRAPVFSTIADFCAFHAKIKKMVPSATGTKEVGLGRWWIDHSERRQYNRVAYLPGVDDPRVLNLWRGFAVEPKAGNCDQYLAHLQENVCRGNHDHFNYLIGWMANCVQFPGRRCETAIVMRGKEGTGKGIAATYFGELFGSHYRHISQPKHLTGHFNAHLQQCSVLFADEAFFAGDRAHEGILKALITEPVLLIEPKGVDPFTATNTLHIIMSSNADWVIPASAEARRFAVFDVDPAHMQDRPYFKALADQMEQGGREALLHFLLHRDLSNFDIRAVPQTEALAEQRAHSRRGVDLLVETLAHEGVLPCSDASSPRVAITSGEDKGEGFFPAARKLSPGLKHLSSRMISMTLQKEWGCVHWRASYQRGIQFPPLSELRAAFDQRHGKQGWPPADEWGDNFCRIT